MSLRGEDALILAYDYTEKSLEGAGALKGQDGKDGVSPVISVNTSTADTYKLDITDKNGTITTPNLVGKQGLQGIQGEQGKPADNPIVTENADNTEDVYKLDLTVGETVFTTKNIIGKQGLEGVSPSVTTNPDNTAEDYRLNITTKGGTFTTPNLRGPQGEIGPQGESAASAINPRGDYDVNADPHYTVSDYITSAEGNTYVCKKDNPNNVAPTDGTVNDEFWQVLALRGAKGESGKDGEKGADGVTFTPSIDENGVLSFTNNGGLENPEPIDIKGDNGVTFTPSIDADGYLSFTNNGNLENPEPIKVLGQDGADGTDGIDGTTYIPSIGTVTTVESNTDASAGVTVDEETKEAVFHFEIPKGAKGEKAVQFTPSITENGELAWENDGDLPNPPTTPIQTLISTAPLGTVLSFAGSTAPNGYLLCDGKSYSVADYEDLYAVIGNTYGGDSTNFNVPNLIDKFIQGSNTSGTEKEAGLPNIEGEWIGSYKHAPYLEGTFEGAFLKGVGGGEKTYGNNVGSGDNVLKFDASKSNAIYGNSDTVQPPALTMVYIIKAFHTNEGTDSGVSDDVVEYVDNKVATKKDAVKLLNNATDSTKWLKLKLGSSATCQPIIVSDQYGGKVEITGMTNDGTYKSAKLVRYSYGDWTTHSATDYTLYNGVDPNYKIQKFYYYPTDGYYYLEIRQWATIKVEGNSTAELVTSLPAEKSEMTLIPESQFASKSDLATKQDNLSIKKAFIRRNASTSQYCLLATIDLRTLNQFMQPLRLKGVIGNMANEILNVDITINGRQGFTPTMLFGAITSKAGVLTNYANILINKSDDGQTAYVYIHFKYAYSYCDLEVYLGSSQYEVPPFRLTDTMQGTEYTNLLDNTNVVVEHVIDDSSTGDKNSTWSSSKIASELKTSENTDKTLIEFDTEYASRTASNSNFYTVRNGICYVYMDFTMAIDNPSGKGILTNALPKPIGVINCQVAPYNNSTIPQGVFILDENGSFIVDKNLKSGERYLYNFSYPTA